MGIRGSAPVQGTRSAASGEDWFRAFVAAGDSTKGGWGK